MLAPEKSVAVANLGSLLQANSRALHWAKLIVSNVLPPLSSPPPWYNTIDRHLTKARSDAETWLAASGPKLFSEVSQATVSYANLFAQVAPELEKVINSARSGSQPLSSEDRQVASELVGTMLASAQEANTTLRHHIRALSRFQQSIQSCQQELNFQRQQALGSRTEISARIGEVEKEVIKVRAVLAANEVNFDAAKMSFATGTMGIIYAVAVAPIFAAGALSMGVALSVAGMGLTIYKLESYVRVLKDASAKLNQHLKHIRSDELEALLISCLIDNLTTLAQAGDKANVMLEGMIAVWQQTSGELTNLLEILRSENTPLENFSKFKTLTTSAAVWQQIAEVAGFIQKLKFESTTQYIVV